MATRRTSFDKLQRERAKRAKQSAKREERQERAAARGEDIEVSVVGVTERLSAGELMERLESAHNRFDNNEIDFETFEEEKRALLERLAALPLD
ncbi:MAG: hypothetical protein ACT4OX_04305 [Actinomycetota bacterium]